MNYKNTFKLFGKVNCNDKSKMPIFIYDPLQ